MKSNFPVSFGLINAEMNLVGNYRTLEGEDHMTSAYAIPDMNVYGIKIMKFLFELKSGTRLIDKHNSATILIP